MTLLSTNHVDPWGRLVSTPERGYLMGNRDFRDAWIACTLRHPDGTTGPTPVSYFKHLIYQLNDAQPCPKREK